jgi:hypothetical protein
VVTNLAATSRFSSLSGAFACDSKKAYQPGGFTPPGIFLPGAPVNPIAGRIAALRGARNPHGLESIPVSCAPGALRFIPVIEFPDAPGRALFHER